jgi:hypothetical protein
MVYRIKIDLDAKAKTVLVKKLIGNEKGKRIRYFRLPLTITVLVG